MEILPTITTIFDWEGKIKEVKELGLKKINVFLTYLKTPAERREFFRLLQNTQVEKIPFVHLRHDHISAEIDYLIENYHTERFNIHTKKEFPYPPDYKKYKDLIYIENTYEPFNEKEIKQFAGICLDSAHLENARLFYPDLYRHNIKIIEKYGCGCNHIGPAKNFDVLSKREAEYPFFKKHPHFFHNLSEFDYLKNYPIRYFSQFIILETENSVKEQLKTRKCILKLLTR